MARLYPPNTCPGFVATLSSENTSHKTEDANRMEIRQVVKQSDLEHLLACVARLYPLKRRESNVRYPLACNTSIANTKRKGRE